MALVLASERFHGTVLLFTDTLCVCHGRWQRLDQSPGGPDADLWHRLGCVCRCRPRSEFAVEHANSHLTAAEAFERRVPGMILLGNAVADVLADIAAQEARVSAEQRGQVRRADVIAPQVRRRLLRAALDP